MKRRPDWTTAGAGEVVVLEDHYGALTLAAAAQLAGRSIGRPGIRVYQDVLSGEHALSNNAADLASTAPELAGLSEAYRHVPLGADLFAGARLVLLQLPRSLAALDELAGAIARHRRVGRDRGRRGPHQAHECGHERGAAPALR